jgi:uncharacterized protein YqgC (DUF456 family)
LHWAPWTYYLFLVLFCGIGLILVFVTLPGLWLMTAAAACYAVFTHGKWIGLDTLIVLLCLSILGEILEIFLTGAAAKQAGGGKAAMAGGVIGGLVGGIFLSLIPIPVLSTMVGICVGSFAGATVFELAIGGEAGHSLKVGWGAAKGRFLGILTKSILGVFMFLGILWKAMPI